MSTTLVIRINAKSEQPYCWNIPIKDVRSYLDLLKSNTLVDEEGNLYEVDDIEFDINQNAVDVSCSEKSSG